MRPAPAMLPETLPKKEKVIPLILNTVEQEDTRLGGRTLHNLLNQFVPSAVCWLTGSRCWMPAVFCEVYSKANNFTGSDFDVVFHHKDEANTFIVGVLGSLEGVYTSKRGDGFATIMGKNTEKVMDVWTLENDESIQELLMSFPYAYQRCAYLLNGQSSIANLTRIVNVKNRTVGRTGSPPRILDGLGRIPDPFDRSFTATAAAPAQTGSVTVTLLCGMRIPYTNTTCQLHAGHIGACSTQAVDSAGIWRAVRSVGPYGR